MFLLTIVEDKIKIMPDLFDRNASDVLREQIEIKYSNKILLNVGLCICFYDFVEIGEPYIYPGEGSSIQVVQFRLVVFRPFVGEVLVGKVSTSNKDGIKISMDFFDDVTVPSSLLQSPSTFNSITGLWTWKYGEELENEFVIEVGEEVRFRVRSIHFTGLVTSAKGVTATMTSESGGRSDKTQSSLNSGSDSSGALVRRRSSSFGLSPDDAAPAAMQVVGSTNDFGLGLVSWW